MRKNVKVKKCFVLRCISVKLNKIFFEEHQMASHKKQTILAWYKSFLIITKLYSK